MSHKSAPQEFPTRVTHKSGLQECPTRVSRKSVLWECRTECPKRVSYKSVFWTYVAFQLCLHSGSWAPSCSIKSLQSLLPRTKHIFPLLEKVSTAFTNTIPSDQNQHENPPSLKAQVSTKGSHPPVKRGWPCPPEALRGERPSKTRFPAFGRPA